MTQHIETMRQALEEMKPVAIHQFRSPHCSDWYDGVPDHHDGRGPYEVRTLYTHPQPKKTQEPKKCGLCGEDRAFTGNCGGGRDKPNALCYEGRSHSQPKAEQTSCYCPNCEALSKKLAEHKPVGFTEAEKVELASNWFAEDWAITKAVGMLHDYDTQLQPKAEQEPVANAATVAGLHASIGHLIALVDHQYLLLQEVNDVCGRDGHGGELEDGESDLIDRVRQHLKAIVAPTKQEPKREWIGLADDEIKPLCGHPWVFETVKQWVQIIEAKLKEKNGITKGEHDYPRAAQSHRR